MSEPPTSSVLSPPLPTAGRRMRWGGLYGSARSLAVARAVAGFEGFTVLVAPDNPTAHRLDTELRFYLDAAEHERILHFPDWETLPYDLFSPHQDIVSERLDTLARLPTLDHGILIAPFSTLMGRMAPRQYVDTHSLLLACGDRFDLDSMRLRLEQAGYVCVSQVMEHGEFAVRGSLLDLFPMGAKAPYRIDLFDDEIESIRRFDPESQRSESTETEVRLLPAREFPSTADAVSRFRREWRSRFEGDPTRCPMYREVSQGGFPSGIEYYLPLFFDETATLFDFLPEDSVFILAEDVLEAGESFWADTRDRYESRRHDTERPVLEPKALFLPVDEVFSAINRWPVVSIERFTDATSSRGEVTFATRAPVSVPIDGRAERPLGIFERFVDSHPGRILVVAETPGRRQVLLETFASAGLHPELVDSWQAFLETGPRLAIAVAPLDHGASLDDPPVAVVSESQLFGERAVQRRRRRPSRDTEAVVRDLSELRLGSPVVHEAHGVGRYLGLETLESGGVSGEFLALEYADGDKLYVPVVSLHLVSRFTGIDPEAAPLHKLGSPQWQRAKRKAAEKVVDVAAELLDIQARRASRPGHAFEVAPEQVRGFEAAFPFEETPDQQVAIDAVMGDMLSPAPMDRLVCGDVGFGKTEVAMRAAFIAVQGGKQVAVLVPTTLLAQQHHQTFSDRFADWAVRVEQLSRFREKAAQSGVVKALADGGVDIVIGTHKLLQSDIHFKRLGLVIIDEEHRFGVRQKERFKALRAETDVLTLTATPIPRTLNLALSGMRDLSLIATPPEKRLSIQTFVRQWDKGLIREACLREIRRGGQIYFVHNKVENIESIASDLKALVPEATVEVAHGQMRERDLERVMLDFYHRRFQILVCTTIIETGIDVPNANTIVINRADRFGLAQLHQLRGRVGRSHHRAYAYLVVPDRRAMTGDAIKRLEAIESLDELGVGFSLATHDLEIRGAGELLGDDQSGQIQQVGFSLYTRLLERAVAALRAGKNPTLDRPLDHGAEIDLRAPALIPDDYLPDVHARLIMYKRIASAPDDDALDELRVEMIDRFGPLPPQSRHLFDITHLKLRAAPLGVRKIDLGPSGGRIDFHREPDIDPAAVIGLLQSNPAKYRLDGSERIRIIEKLPDAQARVDELKALLGSLSVRAAA